MFESVLHNGNGGITKKFVWVKYEKLCAIWYHLYSLKNMENTHEELLLLISWGLQLYY